MGSENLNTFIRVQYLQFIDRKWLDHLENMEMLREAVHLRSYGQKNPLTEYKIEGFQMFDAMIDEIRREIASRVYLVRVRSNEEQERVVRPVVSRMAVATHAGVGAFAASSEPRTTGSTSTSASGNAVHTATSNARNPGGTVVRVQPKVGRNDPCPCGSGKKYKQCHGR